MPLFDKAKNFTINGGNFTDYSSNGMEPLVYLREYAAAGAAHDSAERYPPPRCHKATRERTLKIIMDWVKQTREERKKRSFWLHAPVGMGKTTIAQTIAEECEATGYLGAAFFFSRLVSQRDRAERFVASLALQLAEYIPSLKPHIEAAIVKNPNILTKSLPIQLQKLVIEPFRKIPPPDHDKTVFIDGLDECEGADPTQDREREQALILELVQTLQEADLPLNVVILSRPESWIEEGFEELETLAANTERYDLYAEMNHDNDIERYFRDNIERIRKSPKHRRAIRGPWPPEEYIHCIVHRASGQFAYVSTVIRFIEDPYGNPVNRLTALIEGSYTGVSSNPMEQLYNLYRQILETCPNRGDMTQALGCLLVMLHKLPYQEWRSTTAYDTIVAGEAGAMTRALRGLRAVVCMPSSRSLPNIDPLDAESSLPSAQKTEDSALNLYHSSFLEFLGAKSSSGIFYIDGGYWLLFFAYRCLRFLSQSHAVNHPSEVVDLARYLWPCGFRSLSLANPAIPDSATVYSHLRSEFISHFLAHRDIFGALTRVVPLCIPSNFLLEWALLGLDLPSTIHRCITHWCQGYERHVRSKICDMSAQDRSLFERLLGGVLSSTLRTNGANCFRLCHDRLYFEDTDLLNLLESNGLLPVAAIAFSIPDTTQLREFYPVLSFNYITADFLCLLARIMGYGHLQGPTSTQFPVTLSKALWKLLLELSEVQNLKYDSWEIIFSPSDLDFLSQPALLCDSESVQTVLDFCEAVERTLPCTYFHDSGNPVATYKALYDTFRQDPYGFVSRNEVARKGNGVKVNFGLPGPAIALWRRRGSRQPCNSREYRNPALPF
ncbi:NWD2 [Coprinopsis cinerea okayama7|uniref:NWD2 n=1 Tax=Coprinopsis cinerea (strain Okayama-7 / 130 / ATCC MYA-4618 / FGSC 9003) TaxID=240176 RepID=A8P2E8_COPC7|nr:NWD2 [Coprinopsis cinerea okayama7\|eukprot:XP_001838303.2 NWD2 [Coprinopsis cinerea okayama7\